MGENKEILKRIQDSAVDPLIRRLAKRQVVLRGAGKREREGGGKGRGEKGNTYGYEGDNNDDGVGGGDGGDVGRADEPSAKQQTPRDTKKPPVMGAQKSKRHGRPENERVTAAQKS